MTVQNLATPGRDRPSADACHFKDRIRQMLGVDVAAKAWVSRALDLGSALAISLAGHDQLEDGRRVSRAGFAEHDPGAPNFFGRDAGLVVRARGHLGLDEPGRFDRAARPDDLCRRRLWSRSVPP